MAFHLVRILTAPCHDLVPLSLPLSCTLGCVLQTPRELIPYPRELEEGGLPERYGPAPFPKFGGKTNGLYPCTQQGEGIAHLFHQGSPLFGPLRRSNNLNHPPKELLGHQ